MVSWGPEGYAEARDALRGRQGSDEHPVSAVDAVLLVHSVVARLRQHRAASNAAGGEGPAGTGGAGGTDGAAGTDGTDGPGGTGRAGTDDVLAALTALRHLRDELAGWEPALIGAAREHGVSWASLAPALGVTSRQAAERRYLRLRPSDGGESTGEERVRAERDRRAGDRAVARWARQNSAVLRQLAGQVSALDDLPAPARRHADRVQRALADDDAAALLSPLADAHGHLADTHGTLADQINTVTEHTEQLRRESRRLRGEP